ncbi:hypothetical protein [Thermomonas sp.]|uniref:hypothetical protein n=1 Tax=Thermomonas sp. TaxID=1971895 RepID=UPI002C70AB65|nr:hypothetical protein [Thermomonas sp.]HRO64162.1 hypothetical protein [Thermomonas sp.]
MKPNCPWHHYSIIPSLIVPDTIIDTIIRVPASLAAMLARPSHADPLPDAVEALKVALLSNAKPQKPALSAGDG